MAAGQCVREAIYRREARLLANVIHPSIYVIKYSGAESEMKYHRQCLSASCYIWPAVYRLAISAAGYYSYLLLINNGYYQPVIQLSAVSVMAYGVQ